MTKKVDLVEVVMGANRATNHLTRDEAQRILQVLSEVGVVQLAEDQKLLLPTETEQEQLHIDPEDRTNAAQQLCLLTLMHDELKDFRRVKPLREEK